MPYFIHKNLLNLCYKTVNSSRKHPVIPRTFQAYSSSRLKIQNSQTARVYEIKLANFTEFMLITLPMICIFYTVK